MKTVILAEKPSQARAYIEAFATSSKQAGYYVVQDTIFTDETVVTYGFGHLVELAHPNQYDIKYKQWNFSNLPIFPEKYKFVVPQAMQQQFKVIKNLLTTADRIIIATDSDREGENIAWAIIKKANINLANKELKRLWINSLEKEAILTGFKNLRNGWDFYPIYQEAQTRQISDWLVGMNASPLYTLMLKKIGYNGVYSIGRVQTPTLYMIYERDLAIKNFKSTSYQELLVDVQSTKPNFKAYLNPKTRFDDNTSLAEFLNKHQLEIGDQMGVIKQVKKEIRYQASPRLYSLSSLQSEINRRYHISASDTLKAAQSLYEKKLLTYPRTDCNFITAAEFSYLEINRMQYLALLSQNIELKNTKMQKKHVDSQKVQEHHAIIMTKKVPTRANLKSLSLIEQRIYQLILQTTLAMFCEPYKYEETKIDIAVRTIDFLATGEVPIQLGWKTLFSEEKQKKDLNAKILPIVQVNDEVKLALKKENKTTQALKAFTEGTIITAMKTAGKTIDDEEAQAILKSVEGIGTEATRANILETLKNRQYISIEKNKLHVTEIGMILCQAVALQPLLVSVEMTAKWEKALREISNSVRTQSNFLEQIKKFIDKLILEVPQQLAQLQIIKQTTDEIDQTASVNFGICPNCQNGKIIDKGKIYGCTNYTSLVKCEFIIPKKISDKTLGVTAIKDLLTKKITKKLKGFKSKKTGKKFDAKLKLVENKIEFDFS